VTFFLERSCVSPTSTKICPFKRGKSFSRNFICSHVSARNVAKISERKEGKLKVGEATVASQISTEVTTVGTYDVVGSLCENNDKFAVDRDLPEIVAGDTVVIHDAGAHGHSMGFNYNGKLRSAEYLLTNHGDIVQIRRAETYNDLFATLNFDASA